MLNSNIIMKRIVSFLGNRFFFKSFMLILQNRCKVKRLSLEPSLLEKEKLMGYIAKVEDHPPILLPVEAFRYNEPSRRKVDTGY